MSHALLIPVEAGNPARTQDAVQRAVALLAQEPADVHVLSVQPLVSSHVTAFFGHGELHKLQHEAGSEEMADAVSQLQAAGVTAMSHVRVGRRAETIAATARELHCDTILMGQDDHPGVVDRLFGSVAGQVRHLLDATPGACQVIGT
ncbi:MAG: hypothetical protein RL522_148 [Pseudomonadota bacterium]|jgi:nucleotide-binding universal stress UspA family protein